MSARTLSSRLLALLMALTSTMLIANGLNPPRPARGEPPRALPPGSRDYDCVHRSSGRTSSILAARLTTDGRSESQLDVRLGVAPIIGISLANVSIILIDSGGVSPDGFVTAKIMASSIPVEDASPPRMGLVNRMKDAAVRLIKDGKKLRIVGVSPTGASVDIPLEDCKEVHSMPPRPLIAPGKAS